jgi:hypothetical protein
MMFTPSFLIGQVPKAYQALHCDWWIPVVTIGLEWSAVTSETAKTNLDASDWNKKSDIIHLGNEQATQATQK